MSRTRAILADTTPCHTAFLVDDRVLIMPVMAPFLTEVGAADFARRMRPRHVIPVHVGYAKDFILRLRYDNYSRVFKGMNIAFHQLAEPGDGVTV